MPNDGIVEDTMSTCTEAQQGSLQAEREIRGSDPQTVQGALESTTPDPVSALCLLGELSDAISVVAVVQRSLASQEIVGVGDEEVALRHALVMLRAAYTGLDTACGRA
jgi:hypothetical protein